MTEDQPSKEQIGHEWVNPNMTAQIGMDPAHPGLIRRHEIGEHTTQDETDVFTLLPNLPHYELHGIEHVESAVHALCCMNEIPDPLSIAAGTKLRYLKDPANLLSHRIRRHRVQARGSSLRTIVDEIGVYRCASDEQRTLAVESLASLNGLSDVDSLASVEILYFDSRS